MNDEITTTTITEYQHSELSKEEASLNIQIPSLRIEQWEEIFGILSNESSPVRHLKLMKNEIGQKEVKLLCKYLQTTKTLRSIHLDSNKDISDNGVRKICKAIIKNKSSQLEMLGLQRTNIGKNGVKALATLIMHPTIRLTSLRLDGNLRICDDGAEIICKALMLNSSLSEINLIGCNIFDRGVKWVIIALKCNQHLRVHLTTSIINPNLRSEFINHSFKFNFITKILKQNIRMMRADKLISTSRYDDHRSSASLINNNNNENNINTKIQHYNEDGDEELVRVTSLLHHNISDMGDVYPSLENELSRCSSLITSLQNEKKFPIFFRFTQPLHCVDWKLAFLHLLNVNT